MIVQYYKVIGEEYIPEIGEFIFDGDEVIGFVHKAYESTYDCVLFDVAEFEEYENIICLAEEVKWPVVIKMMKEAVMSNMSLYDEWKTFLEMENINGRFEEV